MTVKQSHYEALLAEYSDRGSAIALLRQYRPYLEMLPSLRRPDESVIVLPLPVARLRGPQGLASHERPAPRAVQLPCDLGILTCDPEWKIKLGVEIAILIHRPEEDFSDLLQRWRRTEVWLDGDYEWLVPQQHEHLLSEGGDRVLPLFVLFPHTPPRIQRGLEGAGLPCVVRDVETIIEDGPISTYSLEGS
ncbi:MAG: hypothetical protein AAFY11_15265 [Cyanobacteria bacterium J06641_5]